MTMATSSLEIEVEVSDVLQNNKSSTQRNTKLFSILCAILGSMTSIMLGYVVSGAAMYIQRDLKISDVKLELLVGTINFFILVGSFLAGKTSDWIGRNKTILLSACTFALSSLVMGLARNYLLLMLGPFIAGIVVGFALTIAHVYTTELAPTSARGLLTSFPEIFINLGVLLGYVSNYFFAKLSLRMGWRCMLGIGVVPSVAMALFVLFMPESPRWFVLKGLLGDAERVLLRTSSSKKEADEKLSAIKEDVRIPLDCRKETVQVPKTEKGHEAWKELLLHPTPAVRRILIAGVGLHFFQKASGIDAVVLYSTRIFRMAGIVKDSKLMLATVGVGLIKTLAILVATFFLDKVGRKPLLLSSLGGMIVSVILLATGLTIVYENPHDQVTWALVLSIVTLLCYVGSFSIGLGPTTWVYSSEIYPLSLRAQGTSIGTVVNRVVSGIGSTTFLSMTKKMTIGGSFFMFAGICIVAWIFVFTLLPETKGRNLEDMHELFTQSRQKANKLKNAALSANTEVQQQVHEIV